QPRRTCCAAPPAVRATSSTSATASCPTRTRTRSGGYAHSCTSEPLAQHHHRLPQAGRSGQDERPAARAAPDDDLVFPRSNPRDAEAEVLRRVEVARCACKGRREPSPVPRRYPPRWTVVFARTT